MRRLIIWFTLFCFVSTQTSALAQSHAEGTAAGQAANAAARPTVNSSSATSVVPSYTTTPAESAYYGQPSLSSAANRRLAACAATPSDPSCQAQTGAMTSANTPRTPVSAYDPAVAAARGIAANPNGVLGSLAGYYAGCTTTDATTPAGTTSKVCHRYTGIGNYSTRRDLTVEVELTPNCSEGAWFAHGQANRNGADYMVAEAQCRIRADGLQRLRFYAAGGQGACIGWQALDLPTTPPSQAALVTNLSPHWQGYCWSPFQVVMMPGSGCTDGNCAYTFQYGTPVYACPAGSVPGNTLSFGDGGGTLGGADECFVISQPDPDNGCTAGGSAVYLDAGMRCAMPGGSATLTGAAGWTLPLSFRQPTMDQHETDTWVDRSATLPAGGRCSVATADRCVDGPGSKIIDGRTVTRACWSYERTLSCSSGAETNECAALASSGCTPATSTCKQANAETGACEVYQDTYNCPAPAQTTTSVSNCPANVFCLGSNCFNTAYTNDADFARSMSFMEAAREAGVYLDPDNLRVFSGEVGKCRDRLLKNCCQSDSAGSGMSNQSVFGTGSRLVFDVLMNSENQQFLYQGMQALLLGGGFSGTFTTYGVTFAVNGAALPAGSAVLYSGESLVVAFDPWSLAIAVIIYIVMSMMSCNESEGRVAMQEGARLCHTVGTYCSSCIRIFGSCVSCIEHTTGKCCFNSVLSRIINEQGRLQIGKGWGSGENPECSGFTIDQLQALNFSAMDLTEFYASIVPTLPNVGALQSGNATRSTNCYYGQGRCQ